MMKNTLKDKFDPDRRQLVNRNCGKNVLSFRTRKEYVDSTESGERMDRRSIFTSEVQDIGFVED